MNGDYKELIEYLDKKFTAIDSQFSVIKGDNANIKEDILTIKDDLFTVKEGLLTVQETLENKADKMDVINLQTAVDAYAKKADTYFQEMAMLSHK